MYIGPWQEYKLARILQLKDKVEQEEKQANKVEAQTTASVSNQSQFNIANNNYAHSEGFKNYENSNKPFQNIPDLNQRRRPRENAQGNKNLQARHHSHNLPKPKMQNYQVTGQKQNNRNINNGKLNGARDSSPTSNNTNYSSKVVKTTTNSFKNGEKVSEKSNIPSNRTAKAMSNDRISYMGSTNNSEARSYASQMLNEMRKNNFFNQFSKQNMNRCLEVTYDKWNRFENFVKFASAKEIKDRLKEVEPPPVEHYIDGDVVYKIKEMGQGRPPRIIKKPLVTEKEMKKQHKERVNKMKELYGLKDYGKIPKTQLDSIEQQLQPITNSNAKAAKVFEYQENSRNEFKEQNYQNHIETISADSNDFNSSSQEMNNIQAQKISADKKNTNSVSLYSFYQGIIDKNNEGHTMKEIKEKQNHPKYQIHSAILHQAKQEEGKAEELVNNDIKESPSLMQKSSKFKNAGREIIHNSPLTNLGKAEAIHGYNKEAKLEEIIEEDIDANNRSSVETSNKKRQEGDTHSPFLNKTNKGHAFDESDGDGLINWALNLPDEFSMSHSSQLYKNSQK